MMPAVAKLHRALAFARVLVLDDALERSVTAFDQPPVAGPVIGAETEDNDSRVVIAVPRRQHRFQSRAGQKGVSPKRINTSPLNLPKAASAARTAWAVPKVSLWTAVLIAPPHPRQGSFRARRRRRRPRTPIHRSAPKDGRPSYARPRYEAPSAARNSSACPCRPPRLPPPRYRRFVAAIPATWSPPSRAIHRQTHVPRLFSTDQPLPPSGRRLGRVKSLIGTDEFRDSGRLWWREPWRPRRPLGYASRAFPGAPGAPRGPGSASCRHFRGAHRPDAP